MSRHPTVKWAQRSDRVYITIDLPDAQDVKLKLDPEGKFLFSATSGADKIPYEVDIDLFDKVDVDESKASVGSRNICYLVKKAENKWWSRLLKQQGKPPVFLKVDWDKWVDEDDETEDKPGAEMDFGDFDFSKMNMGGDGAGALGDDGFDFSKMNMGVDGAGALGDDENEGSDTEEENENVEEKHSAEKKEAAPAAVPAEESNAQKA